MTDPLVDPLATAVVATAPSDNKLRIGTCVGLNPLDVQIQGVSVELAGWLDTGASRPAIGDDVALLRQDNTWLVLGAIAAGNAVSTKGAVIGANVATSTGFQANSTVIGTEVAFASASWNISESTYNFLPGQAYEMVAQISPITNGAGASAGTIRIRKGAATITGLQLMQDYTRIPAGFAGSGGSQWTRQYLVNATGATISTKLSLTSTLLGGAGSMGIYGGDGNVPTLIIVRHIGAYADNAGLLIAGTFASLT